MKTPWTLQDGWLILQKRINDGTSYALFTQYPILDNNVVDMTLQVILKTGLFAQEYGEWHVRPEEARTWSHLKAFMKKKCRLKKVTGNAASQFGYAMSAVVKANIYNKEMNQAYAQSMANFSAGHVNTTNTIDRLRKTKRNRHKSSHISNNN